MVEFVIKNPDGRQSFTITAPDGTTERDVFKKLETGELKLPDRPDHPLKGYPSIIPAVLDNFLTGALAGVARGVLGAPQAGADVLSRVGALTPETADNVSKAIHAMVAEIERSGGPAYNPQSRAAGVGRFVGEVLPGAMVGGGAGLARSVITGAGTGALATQDAENVEDRETGRLIGAGVGAVGGAVADRLGTLIAKIGNARAVGNQTQELAKTYRDFNPDLGPARAKLNKAYETATEQLDTLRHRIDLIGNSSVTFNNSAFNAVAQNALKNFDAMADTPPVLRRAAGQMYTLSKEGKLNYSAVTRIRDTLETFLDTTKLNKNGRIANEARDLLKFLNHQVKLTETPELKAAQRLFERTQQKLVDPLKGPGLTQLRQATTPTEQADAMVDIVLSGSSADRTALLKTLGKSGQTTMQSLLISRALEASATPAGGVNTKMFLEFFSQNKGAQEVIDQPFQLILKGISNLLDNNNQAITKAVTGKTALQATGSTVDRLGHSFLHHKLWQNEAGGAAGAGAALIANSAIFRGLDALLKSQRGHNLLLAAGRAKPGTPRMEALVTRILAEFGASSAGVGGAALGAQ